MITAFCLIKLRRTEPELKRPYRIPGGTATAWFAGISMTLLLILLFIPDQPVFMGLTATALFLGWMMIGVVLYILDYRQRQRYSKLKRTSFLFASMAVSDVEIPGYMDLFEDNYLILSFVVPKDAIYTGRSLTELGWGKNYSIFIIKIEHGTEMLMLPSGRTVINGKDRVFAVGLKRSLRRFSDGQDIGEKYTMNTMKDFMGFGATEKQAPLNCTEVRVSGNESYCGQEIRHTGMQENHHCMIIGVKRNGETTMMPKADMVIEKDDILWIVGSESNIEELTDRKSVV